jgi:hypothetical protein
MRFMMMHKTDAKYEGGAKPTLEEAQRIGEMVGALVQSGVLVGGDGLGPSSEGARVRLSQGKSSVTPGPFKGTDAFPARYAMFKASSVEQAADYGARFGRIFGDVVVDVRPVNEAWDLGFEPKPEGLTTRRYMAVVNADAVSEAGAPLSEAQEAALKAYVDELTKADAFLGMEHLEPSRKGKRLRRTAGAAGSGGSAGSATPAGKAKFAVLDGPFSETKELIGGFAIVEVPSIEEAVRLALDYGQAVDVEEMDIRGFYRVPDSRK